ALVPFTNTNLEPDLALLAPAGVSVHVARLGGYDAEEIPDTEQMAGLGAADMDEPLRLLAGVRPDVVLYGCTSATLAHGTAFDRELAAKVERAMGAPTVTAAGALVAALDRLSARRIAFASPYVEALNDAAIAFLADQSITTIARADIDATLDNEGQGALTPAEVMELARKACAAAYRQLDALVLSCTDMRSVEAIDDLERELGIPVVSSNQALMRSALDVLGLPPHCPGFGQLLA
ncbi:MAG: Asp/Glu racemase, partial [Planctomycetota bacterium]